MYNWMNYLFVQLLSKKFYSALRNTNFIWPWNTDPSQTTKKWLNTLHTAENSSQTTGVSHVFYLHKGSDSLLFLRQLPSPPKLITPLAVLYWVKLTRSGWLVSVLHAFSQNISSCLCLIWSQQSSSYQVHSTKKQTQSKAIQSSFK